MADAVILSPPTVQPGIRDLVAELRACRICRDEPRYGAPLAHEPRPIIQASATARLCIASQAPGTLAHKSGVPFKDPSGKRLRAWLGLDEAAFYDASRVAIVPMGSCFPGQDAKGGDLPPRRECAEIWRNRLFAAMPAIEIMLLVGQYSQRWHLGDRMQGGLTATVANWRAILDDTHRPRLLPMPHPSWRNNGWLKSNLWFEAELLPVLRAQVQRYLGEDWENSA